MIIETVVGSFEYTIYRSKVFRSRGGFIVRCGHYLHPFICIFNYCFVVSETIRHSSGLSSVKHNNIIECIIGRFRRENIPPWAAVHERARIKRVLRIVVRLRLYAYILCIWTFRAN